MKRVLCICLLATACSSGRDFGSTDSGVPAVDSGPTTNACAANTYPLGPYGTGVGKVVNPGLSWKGYLPNATDVSTIAPTDLYDCDGSKGIDAIIFDVAAQWCAACQSQAANAPQLFSQYDQLGIHVVTLVVQDASTAPATTTTAEQWKDAIQADRRHGRRGSGLRVRAAERNVGVAAGDDHRRPAHDEDHASDRRLHRRVSAEARCGGGVDRTEERRAVKLKLAALLSSCVACSAALPIGSDAGTPVKEAGAASDTGVVEEAGAPKVSVSGDVVDSENAAWASAKIQVCSETVCTLGNADGSGAFHVLVASGDRYHVIARPAVADTREGSAGLFVLADALTADVTLDSPVHLPVTGAHFTLSSPANVTSDLTLTANAADLAFYGDAFVAGVSIAQAEWPAFTIAGKTILAMWALNPWGTRANAGKTIAVTMSNAYGLAANDTASVYAVNELTAELGTPTTATVSGDAKTLDGATIDRVTWVVLAH